jgi:hypothetical protein
MKTQRVGGIGQLYSFFNLRSRYRWVFNAKLRPLYPREGHPVPTLYYHAAGVNLWLSRTVLLTSQSTDLPEKLAGPHLVKKSPAFYVTRMFMTVFTRAGHLSVS